MTAFTRFCEEHTGERFSDYNALQRFSVAQRRRFWGLLLRWSGLIVEGTAEPVCAGDQVETAVFFPRLRLNYAENLLRAASSGDDDRPALTACSESGEDRSLSRGELRDQVERAAAGLRRLRLCPGDRVVALATNSAESVIACLAATGLGATWSSVSPDLGDEAVLNRFRPLDPVLLFAHGSHVHQGVVRALDERLETLVAGLPTLRGIVWLDAGPRGRDALASRGERLSSLIAAGEPVLRWPRLPFNHPLFILFSSGTTGAPKCIVHGAGGTLLEHVKEHRLHSDLGAADRLYFHTTCGWMMWNWQLSALASGSEIVLYDGSISYPEDDALWRLVSRRRVTVFGSSPTYLQYCRDAGIVPAERVGLGDLRLLQSTGSILFDSQYDWVRENVKPLPVQSISGGTDIIGCFVLGNPNLPVYRGESQCLSLGLDVRAQPAPGSAAAETGELVCAAPFPSRPLGLLGDAAGRRFHEAYFSQNPGVWSHGDSIRITPRGTARILGRSDGVLNVRGLRIGPAEIYHVLQTFPELVETMALEQEAPREPGGSRLVLLVVLRQAGSLDRALTLRIKRELARRASPAHVPALIAEVAALPTTFSGKRSERAARDALHGRPVPNASALKNPECLASLRAHPALRLEVEAV